MAFTITQVNAEVRYLLGGLTVSVMSDTLMDSIIQRSVDDHSLEDADLCIVTYESLIAVLRYLIRAQAAGAGGVAGSGAVKSREEERGRQRIKIQYDVGVSGVTASSWETLLDDFIANPQYVCESLLSAETSGSGNVIIGGVSQKQYNAVLTNPDGRNGSTPSSFRNSCSRVSGRRGIW
jgi:hypothetical protein